MATTVYRTKWCVYGHYVDGKCIYIGMGRPWRAFNIHERFQDWFDLTGGGYQVEILSWHDTKAEALAVEAGVIRDLRPPCNRVHNGWVPEAFQKNWKRGSQGRSHTSKSKEKMAERQRSAWARGRSVGGTPRIKVRCVETGERFASMSAVALRFGVSVAAVSASIAKERKTAGLTFVRDLS